MWWYWSCQIQSLLPLLLLRWPEPTRAGWGRTSSLTHGYPMPKQPQVVNTFLLKLYFLQQKKLREESPCFTFLLVSYVWLDRKQLSFPYLLLHSVCCEITVWVSYLGVISNCMCKSALEMVKHHKNSSLLFLYRAAKTGSNRNFLLWGSSHLSLIKHRRIQPSQKWGVCFFLQSFRNNVLTETYMKKVHRFTRYQSKSDSMLDEL